MHDPTRIQTVLRKQIKGFVYTSILANEFPFFQIMYFKYLLLDFLLHRTCKLILIQFDNNHWKVLSFLYDQSLLNVSKLLI